MCFCLTNENTHARQTSSELGLLSLNRVFHGIRLIFGQLHRVTDFPLCVSHFECAPVFWLTSSISVATRPFESELSWFSLLHRLTMQRYNIFRALPNFGHRFGAVFSTKSPNFNEPSLEICSLATEGTQEHRGLESVIFGHRRLLFVAGDQGCEHRSTLAIVTL